MVQHWIENWEADIRRSLPNLSRRMEHDLKTIRDAVAQNGSYVFRCPNLGIIADSIAEETELGQLTKLLRDASVAAGFQHATLFVLRQGRSTAFKTRVCTSYPEDWIARYGSQNYQNIDPVMSRAMQASAPFRFDEVWGSSGIEAAFWSDAEAHGIGRNGLTIPVSLPCDAKLAISFSSSNNQEMVGRQCEQHLSDLCVLAELAGEAFGVLGRTRPVQNSALTEEELHFLRILVVSDDPENALAVMPKFGSVRSMQQSIQEKLGVRTILQAVALASLHNWFDDVPFSMADVSFVCERLKGWGMVEQGFLDSAQSA